VQPRAPVLRIGLVETKIHAADVRRPADLAHGRVLHQIVGSDARVAKSEPKPVVAIPGMPKGEESSNVTDTEADEMEEHLRGLGYLE
jgi:hypothetical protein